MQSATYETRPAPSQDILDKYLTIPNYSLVRRNEIKEQDYQKRPKTEIKRGNVISCEVEVDAFTTKKLFGMNAKAYMAADALFNKIEQAKLAKNREDNTYGLIAHHVSIGA